MHDLGHGRPVEIGLPAEGLEPALFDLKVHALRLAARLLGVLEGGTLGSPPVDELTQVVEHRRRYLWVAMKSTLGGHAWGRINRCRQPELFEALGDGRCGEVE